MPNDLKQIESHPKFKDKLKHFSTKINLFSLNIILNNIKEDFKFN